MTENTNSESASDKPAVFPDGKSSAEIPLPDFSDLPDTEIANREHHTGGPYIPGYSEEEAARDVEAGERFASAGEIHGLTDAEKEEYYERFGTGPIEKQWDLRFHRVAGPNGEPNSNVRQRMIVHQREGYRPVKTEHFEEGGPLDDYDVPPDAEVAPDGTIRRLDTALFFKPADDGEDTDDTDSRTPLDQIPEDKRIVEDEESGSQAVSYPTN